MLFSDSYRGTATESKVDPMSHTVLDKGTDTVEPCGQFTEIVTSSEQVHEHINVLPCVLCLRHNSSLNGSTTVQSRAYPLLGHVQICPPGMFQ